MKTYVDNLNQVLAERSLTLPQEHTNAALESFVRTVMAYDQVGRKTVEGRHPVCVVSADGGAIRIVATSSQYPRLRKYPPAVPFLPGGKFKVRDGQYKVYVTEVTVPARDGYLKVLVPTHYVAFRVATGDKGYEVIDLREIHLCAHDNTINDPSTCRACKGAGIYSFKVQ